MPVLIRFRTPDFEFSVWANDISQRLSVHQRTLASRASLTPAADTSAVTGADEFSDQPIANPVSPCHLVRFAPAIQLIDSDSSQGLAIKGQVLDDHVKHTELELVSPLFFENTQYQFEWVFLGEVKNACVTHRSQSVNEAFRFVPEIKTQRGVAPARLTGSLNTGNDVGWLRLPIRYELAGNMHSQHIAFEVLPTKMVLHQDLPAMYQIIDQAYPLWRFSLVEKTEQDAATSQRRGHFPLMWLEHFSRLRARFEQGLKVICAAPHSRLQPTAANVKAAKLKGRVAYQLAEQLKQDFANGQYDKRYLVEKKKLSVDTPENRFIKMAVSRSKRELAELERKLRKSNQAPEKQRLSDSFLTEIHSWQQPLQKVLNQSFFNEVGAYAGSSCESLVLQQKTGYSAVYRVWQELKFYLDVFSCQSSISMKSVADIYEVWCFLCIKQILQEDLGFELVERSSAKLLQNVFFEYQLKDGLAGAFQFKRADGVTAKLTHEPKFTKQGKKIRSYLVSQEPDIVLEVTMPDGSGSFFSGNKQFIWLFDAKYRIKNDKGRFDDVDVDGVDYVPDDAINQMHRYRDALIRLTVPSLSSNEGLRTLKSRPVVGAFALYPGFFNQTQEPNPYASAIDEVGIGAFALLPSQQGASGHQWLLDFLRSQLGTGPSAAFQQVALYSAANMAERLYVQEAARIPYAGMRQVLYPDLTMTVALGGQRGRAASYFERFEQGTAQWYHLPQSTFLGKLQQHVAEEIRYLALASTSDTQSTTKKIDKIWPVKSVVVVPRYAITEEQAGKPSTDSEPYFLFKLGRPLWLQTPVTQVPHRPLKHSMKLTTLDRLDGVLRFNEIDVVYAEAMSCRLSLAP